MSQNVKKNNNSGRKTPAKGAPGRNASVKGSSSVKNTGKSSAAKKEPLKSTNMNAARSQRSRAAAGMGELEEKGYVTRSKRVAKADPNAQAKKDDIIIIVVTLICILMVLSYLGICGIVGTGINAFVFGLFGRLGYILPVIIWVLTLFIIANKDNGVSPLGIVYAVLLSAVLGALIQLSAAGYNEEIGLFDYYTNSSLNYEGEFPTYGGLFGGIFVKLLCPFVGKVAAVLILIALLLILFVLMTGKPFIMAVFRKINKRIEDFKRRRAIERSEQDLYDDSIDEEEEKPVPKVRYGVRRMPRRRMGTMEVAFSKNGEQVSPRLTARTGETLKNKDQRRNDSQIKTVSLGRGEAEVKTEKFTSAKKDPGSLYIPGVGNVRLGKDASDYREEDYTDKDFEETAADSFKPQKETTRKENPFEEDGRITSVGVKKLHSGSLNAGTSTVNTNVTGIHDIPMDEDEDDQTDGSESNVISILSGRGRKSSEQSVNSGYSDDKEIAESISGLMDEDGTPDYYRTGDFYDGNVQNNKASFNDDSHEDTESENRYENDRTGKSIGNESVSGRRTQESRPVEVSAEEIRNADAAEASEQYSKVTRIGSGAAVFTDMSKAAEEPKALVLPEYKFPSVKLLNKSRSQQHNNNSKRIELENTIQKLQSTFESFGVGVKVTDASVGPTVTRYELLPDQGVKVKTITSLSDDIKLALAAPEIRIEAPIPGKAAVGIEVPNKESAAVLFGDLIDTDDFRNFKSNLAFTVGKDIGGKSIISDIGDMPHALIAGATGSGKSVCINALIMSILYKAKPTDVKLIMIDPKRVELVGYNGIPHLIVPVVTDVKKAAGALAWAVAEMDTRYKLFADAGVRDLAAYNNQMIEKWMEESNEGECPDKLPQIVIIVDELNDLMMTANSKDVEADIARLTQLARACGIHVILATQRPSVNVITGTIKANIPTRIAFAVSSIVDSRTILDQAGAEKLLGKGDMLYYPRGYAKPVRLQGVYVSDKEVNEVVAFIKKQYKEMKYNDIVSQHIDAKAAGSTQSKDEGAKGDDSGYDELFEEAGRFIIEKQKSSVGMLQRVFKIGFNRAARIMDQLAEEGIVGPEEGTKPRKILMTKEEFEQYISTQK